MGLPDFRVPIELQPGVRHFLLVRDVPACVFWQGFPESPDDGSSRADHHRRLAEWLWRERVLMRVTLLPRLDLDRSLHRRARVEARAGAAGQFRVLHRRGIAHGTVAPDENRAVAGERSSRPSRCTKLRGRNLIGNDLKPVARRRSV